MVPALALVEGAEPLCGSELALLELDGVLALALVSVELAPMLPLAEPAGVEALAEVDGELELISLALAVVLSSMPWTFT